jgi:hypothetical protein
MIIDRLFQINLEDWPNLNGIASYFLSSGKSAPTY